MRPSRLWIVPAACLALAASAPAGDVREGAARGGHDDELARAEAAADFVRLIRDADRPEQAVRAYARGCAVDETNVAIRSAYLRRMLRFGRPQIAVYAARVLVRLEPDHALAWAVLGYDHGTRKEWAEAYEATARALVSLSDDPSVLHNAGQLVAWQEAQHPPAKLSDRARRAIETRRRRLNKQDAFVRAYRAVRAFYEKAGKIVRALDRKAELVRTEIAVVSEEGRRLEAAVRELGDLIAVHEREIRRLRRRLRDTVRRRVYVDEQGEVVHEEVQVASWRYRRELEDRIDIERRVIDQLEPKLAARRRELHAAVRQRDGKRRELARLEREKARATAGVERVFRWEPPAVDGVVTPAARDALVLRPGQIRPKATGTEAEADRRLRLADTYLANHRPEKAAAILQALLARYPHTEAAEAARILQQSIDPTRAARQGE